MPVILLDESLFVVKSAAVKIFPLQCKGPSMEGTLFDGDIVYVNKMSGVRRYNLNPLVFVCKDGYKCKHKNGDVSIKLFLMGERFLRDNVVVLLCHLKFPPLLAGFPPHAQKVMKYLKSWNITKFKTRFYRREITEKSYQPARFTSASCPTGKQREICPQVP